MYRYEGELTAGRRNMYAGIAYMLSHALLAIFIIFIAQGIEYTIMSVEDTHSQQIRHKANLFLAYGCASTSYLLIFMRILHCGFIYRFSTLSRYESRLVLVTRIVRYGRYYHGCYDYLYIHVQACLPMSINIHKTHTYTMCLCVYIHTDIYIHPPLIEPVAQWTYFL